MARKTKNNNHSNTVLLRKKPQNKTESIPETLEATTPKLSKNKVFWSRVKRKALKHVYLLRALLLLLVVGVFFATGTFSFKALGESNLGFYAKLLKNFATTPSDQISTIDNRVNILILGKGGVGHDAPDLTDTIIFASLKNKPSGKIFGLGDQSDLTMVSLPRDIWNTPLRAKLNSIYYWGNERKENGGMVLAKSVVEEIVGQPVQYGVVVDFSGFKKIIDVLGGIDVDVQNPFTDNEFPIAGRENDLCDGDPEYRCRYETVSFEKGVTHMDGSTALKFVRSRHAEGDEGTDLARSARQEKVIEAIKNKVLTKEIYLHPSKLIEVKNVVLESIETDITPEQAAILTRWFLEARDNVNSRVLTEDLLENPPKLPQYDNLYVFVPKELDNTKPGGRSWSLVQEWVKCVLDGKVCD